MKTHNQQSILASMTDKAFYPHPAGPIDRCETHISTVFLTGEFVYKIKKPVDLGFLDFTSLEKRRYFCQRETILNRRLSQGIYLDAVPIVLHDGRYQIGGPGEAVEYAVKMRQLDEGDAMLPKLRAMAIENADIERLVHSLVHFYERTDTFLTAPASSTPAWKENLLRIASFVDRFIDRAAYEFIRTSTYDFYRDHQTLFERRHTAGKVKDGHGDLRTDHVYFTENGIQIIDCIEFNNHLRILDVICDLAFLAMDLQYHGFPEVSATLIRAYVQAADDVEALPLLWFYCCYRAMVRCKVNCYLLAASNSQDSDKQRYKTRLERYLFMAHEYARHFAKPVLWVMCGLPASGKSTLGKALAALFDIQLLRSDVIRKKLFTDRSADRSQFDDAGSIYSPRASDITYHRLLSLARQDLERGKSVVVDATFRRQSWRAQAVGMAAELQADVIYIVCHAPEPVLVKRLQQREIEPSISDARLVHLQSFKKNFEPFCRVENEILVRVNTKASPRVCLQKALLAAFESKWVQ